MFRTPFGLSFLLLFLAWTLEVIGDADFDSVKVKMIKNTSGRWDSRIKYWRESSHPIFHGFTSLRSGNRRVIVSLVPLDDYQQ